ncbi:MAG TPA: xanthine dehydrogenase family protein molybdopterin-binding subunit [Acidimicrobiales bacterium]|nr:xanthine dehydrogenase family protein molybdopterin-binding subunit [Acidimicrobiales bacterium]
MAQTVGTISGPLAARYVGQSVRRKEDPRLLTGHGRYVDDVVTPRMLHAAFLRSTAACGRILRLDTSAAAALEGVVAVFTGADLHGDETQAWNTMLGGMPLPFRPLAEDDVRFVGDPVALIVATSRYIAEDGAELVEVEYEESAATVNYRTADQFPDRLVHLGKESNALVAVPFMALSPDLDEAFSNAAHVAEATIEQHRYNPVPMETRGILASFDRGTGELDVVLSTQSVHESRNFLSRYLGIPEPKIRVSMRDVGGGFGQKMFVGREETAVAMAARLLGRSVKWVEDRWENLVAAPHARNETGHVRIAIDADGAIQAITVAHETDIGAYPACPAGMNPALLPGPYRIPRLGFSTTMNYTNTMGRGAYRGPWMFETTAREMMLDIAAREIGMDPIELRRRNILRLEDLPFTSPSMQVFKEVRPEETLEQALQAIGFASFREEQAAARAEGRYLGLGVSVYIEPTSMSAPGLQTDAALVRVDPSGSVTVFMGTNSHGQSIETTMAQVVADNLGVDIDDVTFVQGDTQSTPYGAGTGGSRTAVIAGSAAREASLKVRDKVVAIASHVMEAAPDDLEINSGVISVRGTPTRSMTLGEVAKVAYANPDTLPVDFDAGLEASARFKPTDYSVWANATHACLVEIDTNTWLPRILRYVVSEDCGNMINPMVVHGQVCGGVVQGIGGVLYENFVYDADGNPLTTTFMDYMLPTASEVPDIEVSHVETPSSSNPGGFKGMGEGGAIGAPAAVANAIADALVPFGVRVTTTPLGPNEIFELVTAARTAG